MKIVVSILFVILLSAPGATFAVAPWADGGGDAENAHYENRSHIQIQGDEDLREGPLESLLPGYGPPKDNGVRSGSGTRDDPFVIERWSIEYTGAGDGPAVWIKGTSDHLVIQDLHIWSTAPEGHQANAIVFDGVHNVVIEGVQIDGLYLPLLVHGSQGVEVKDLTLERGRLDVENSDRVVIKDVRIEGDYAALSLTQFTGSLKNIVLNQTTDDGVAKGESTDGSVMSGIAVWHSRDCEDNGRWSRWDIENVRIESYEESSGIKVFCRGTVNVSDSYFGENKNGVRVIGGELQVIHSDFTGNEVGVLVEEESCPCGIELSNFYLNDVHVENQAEAVVDARNNWWGSPEGPSEDAIKGDVEYEPWSTQGPGPDVRESPLPPLPPILFLLGVILVVLQPRLVRGGNPPRAE